MMNNTRVNWHLKFSTPATRIAILIDEIRIWEDKLKDSPDDIPYLNYIKTTLLDRVKELEDSHWDHLKEGVDYLDDIQRNKKK
tara:strand:+ start:235 stop:483 length:249 start_codon:yes stop_codon:yes gene_type:complete